MRIELSSQLQINTDSGTFLSSSTNPCGQKFHIGRERKASATELVFNLSDFLSLDYVHGEINERFDSPHRLGSSW